MNRILFAVSVVLVAVLSSISFGYSGGSGTAGDPYQIATKADLLAFAASGDYTKCFILTANIDMEGQVFTTAIIGPNGSPEFRGTFDGNEYKITHFTINGPSSNFVGLFGAVNAGGLIKNLGLENCTFIGGNSNVGSLVGWNQDGILSNCYSTGSVTGIECVGGLVGTNYSYSGSISKCYSTGAVNGTSKTGGLIGWNYQGSISNCYAIGAVIGSNSMIGGLIGYNDHGNVSYCYSTGAVSGSTNVGGLVGYAASSNVLVSFWNTETSGQPTSAGGTGKTTVEMKAQSTFSGTGWDFLTIWNIVESQTYPFFRRAGYSGGSGTAVDPYKLAKAEDLLTLAINTPDYNKYFIMMDDIDIQGPFFTRAIIAADILWDEGFQGTAFTGSFDGKVYNITHFTIDGYDNAGLFGRITTGGAVKNLGLDNCAVGGHQYVGGLAGFNYGSISNCHSAGTVEGLEGVGGLVGWNESLGDVSNCYSTADVYGTYQVGGFIGANRSDNTSNCYSTGIVSGLSYIGGLAGYNSTSSTISNCYSTGIVSGTSDVGGLVGYNAAGNVLGSFWDEETSGLMTSSGGMGKMTAEMKMHSTFISAGWDFAYAWGIGDGQTYPYLKPVTGINPADINYSGKVDMQDLAIVAANWLEEI